MKHRSNPTAIALIDQAKNAGYETCTNAAKRTDISSSTVNGWANRGRVKTFLIGPERYVLKTDVDRMALKIGANRERISAAALTKKTELDAVRDATVRAVELEKIRHVVREEIRSALKEML